MSELEPTRERFAAIRESVFRSKAWHRLSKAASDVYVAMALWADRGAGRMFRTEEELAADTGFCLRAVQLAVGRLIREKLIARVESGRRGRAAVYHLLDVPNGDSTKGHSPKDHSTQNGSALPEHPCAMPCTHVPNTANGNASHQSSTRERTEHTTEEEGPAAPTPSAETPSNVSDPSVPRGPVPPAEGVQADQGRDLRDVPSNLGQGSRAGIAGGGKIRKPRAAGGKPIGLSDDQVRAVVASPDGMLAYLLHGQPGIGVPRDRFHELTPGPGHWAPLGRDFRYPEGDLSDLALASWVWWVFCFFRAKGGLALALPDWGLLRKMVNGLRAKVGQKGVVDHTWRIAANFPAIQAAIGGAYGNNLALDERILSNLQVLEKSDRLAAGQALAGRSAVGAVTREGERYGGCDW